MIPEAINRLPPLATSLHALSRARNGAALLAALAVVLAAGPAAAAPQLQQIVSCLTSPIYVTSARDGTGRLFIVEQGA